MSYELPPELPGWAVNVTDADTFGVNPTHVIFTASTLLPKEHLHKLGPDFVEQVGRVLQEAFEVVPEPEFLRQLKALAGKDSLDG